MIIINIINLHNNLNLTAQFLNSELRIFCDWTKGQLDRHINVKDIIYYTCTFIPFYLVQLPCSLVKVE